MNKNIIKYHNNFNLIGLKYLTEKELNVLFEIIRNLQERKSESVLLYFKDLKENSGLTYKRISELSGILESIFDKLQRLFIKVTSEDGQIWERIIIFQKFKVDNNLKTVEIKVNKESLYFFNELSKNFTKIDYQTYKSFKSKYNKEIYRRLRQFQRTKLWRVKIEDFKEFVGVPDNTDFKYIKSYILTKNIYELQKVYPNLRIDYIYEKSSGRGRPKVKTLEFKWDKNYIIVNGKKVNPDTGEIYVEPVQNTASIEEIDNTLKNLSAIEEDALFELLLKKRAQRKSSQQDNYPEWASDRTKEIMNRRFLNE